MPKVLSILALLAACACASAAALDRLSHAEAVSGLKQALAEGSAAAVVRLGAEDGFFGNPKVKIPLPPALQRVESALRYTGMRRQADELVLAMNRAAEAAVPQAQALLLDAVSRMSVHDAKGILSGSHTAATEYFKRSTQAELAERFLPVVRRVTARTGLAQQYNALAAQAAHLGLIREQQATIEAYVTHRALDGLYLMIGEQEKALRENPLVAASDSVKRVFGATR